MTKETISRYLENGCKGHKNVVSSRELERALGISGNELRRHINRLRRGTVPIAADQRGYYYAETAAEVYATIRSLEKMRSGLDAAISGLERALEKFGEYPSGKDAEAAGRIACRGGRSPARRCGSFRR